MKSLERITDIKKCGLCRKTKPLKNYYKNRNTYQSYCKECFKVFNEEAKIKNEIEEINRKYRRKKFYEDLK